MGVSDCIIALLIEYSGTLKIGEANKLGRKSSPPMDELDLLRAYPRLPLLGRAGVVWHPTTVEARTLDGPVQAAWYEYKAEKYAANCGSSDYAITTRL